MDLVEALDVAFEGPEGSLSEVLIVASMLWFPPSMSLRDRERAKVVALVHGRVAQSPGCLTGLIARGLDPREIAAVMALVQRPGQSWAEHIACVSRNRLATTVKLAWLWQRMDIGAAAPGTVERLRLAAALERLEAAR